MSAGERRRKGTGSFLLGGVLGASAAFAAARRRRRRRRHATPTGLAAFESAPCFREVTRRDGARDA